MLGGPDINGILLYKYNEQYVVEIQGSVFSSTNIHQYYCTGTKLDLINPDDFLKFIKLRREIKVLYGTKIWN